MQIGDGLWGDRVRCFCDKAGRGLYRGDQKAKGKSS